MVSVFWQLFSCVLLVSINLGSPNNALSSVLLLETFLSIFHVVVESISPFREVTGSRMYCYHQDGERCTWSITC